ncbi:uncharacterized protein LOC143458865 isoform X1 [Clavelina lepadiformis]|uniref:uncharacterized protein LOC143458865 isoform X1 n=1 Tax=Clavelina lepadiformis TaxID=159417 RepID=UPI004042BA56
MVVCQCGHYPVTRVVWTQGHKRSTGEFTRAPSLLASKLLVFPNKLDYNEAKISTITSTVFSASTLQCLYWLDANNGWEDSLSKVFTRVKRTRCLAGSCANVNTFQTEG